MWKQETCSELSLEMKILQCHLHGDRIENRGNGIQTAFEICYDYTELNFCCRAEKEQSFGTIPVGL